jgi:hypothetical protein
MFWPVLIIQRISIFSDTVSIFVGADNQVFQIPKGLLALHSGYFKNRFDNKEEDEKLSLPDVQPSVFAEFLSWLYYSDCLEVNGDSFFIFEIAQAWGLGELIEAPGFQNWCMDTIRTYCKEPPEDYWLPLDTKDVATIYRDSSKYSKLRMFAAHSMACKSPFDKSQEGTERYKEWTKEWTTLLENVPDLISDIARVAELEWNGTHPWDDEHRKAYLVDQVAPDQLWEEQILAARRIEEIKAAATGNCIRSMIELAYIERKKGNSYPV